MFKIALLCLTCVVAATQLHAAGRTSAITGEVRDQAGLLLPHAGITIFNTETGGERRVATDQDGAYRAAFLELGRYRVTVEAAGFATHSTDVVELALDREAVVKMLPNLLNWL